MASKTKTEQIIDDIRKADNQDNRGRLKNKLQELDFLLRQKAGRKTRNEAFRLLKDLGPRYTLDPNISNEIKRIRNSLEEQAFEESTLMKGEQEPGTEKITIADIMMYDILNLVFGVIEEDEEKVESLNNQGFNIKSVERLRGIVQENVQEQFKKTKQEVPLDQVLDSEFILKLVESEDDLKNLEIALQGALPKKPGKPAKKAAPPTSEKKPTPPAPSAPPMPSEAEGPTLEDLETEFQKNPKFEFILHTLMGNWGALKAEGFDVNEEQLLDFMKERRAIDAFTEFAKDRESAIQILLDQKVGGAFKPEDLEDLYYRLRGVLNEYLHEQEKEFIEPVTFDETKVVPKYQTPKAEKKPLEPEAPPSEPKPEARPPEEAVEPEPEVPPAEPEEPKLEAPPPLEKKEGAFAQPPPSPAEPVVPAPAVTIEESKETREMKRKLLRRMGLDIRRAVKPLLMVIDISLDTVKDEGKKEHLEDVQEEIQNALDSIPIDELREIQKIRYREKKEKLKPFKEDLELLWADVQKVLQEELFDVLPEALQKIIGKKSEEPEPEKKPEEVDYEALVDKILNSKNEKLLMPIKHWCTITN